MAIQPSPLPQRSISSPEPGRRARVRLALPRVRSWRRELAYFLLAYLAAQLLVLPASLIWLYRRSKPVYRQLRTTIIATWLIAVPIMALFPVAPPRLMSLGMTDTVSQQAAVTLTGNSTIFYNPYAAVPSLHVGFAFAIGIALATALHAPWAKLLALLWGPVVSLTVVATANHYIFDIATGLIVTTAGYTAGRTLNRRHTALAATKLWGHRRAAETHTSSSLVSAAS